MFNIVQNAPRRITRLPGGGPSPLSAAQRRLWVLHQFNPQDASINRPLAIRLTGALDRSCLWRSLDELVRRHEILRSVFPTISGKPVQIVNAAGPLPIEFLDLEDCSDRNAEARRVAAEQTRRPFDLATGPLLRVVLIRLGESDHVLLFLMHHIVFDGWSETILLHELRSLYQTYERTENIAVLQELPFQYTDYSRWQNDCFEKGALDSQLAYWLNQLAGVPPLQLCTDGPGTSVPVANAATCSAILPADLHASCKDLCRKEKVTMFMLLLAAYQALLGRYSGQDDFAVGVPIAGRLEPETEKLIGCFMNVLVFRAALSGTPSFREILQRVKRIALDAFAYQQVPFEKLVEKLRPERSVNGWPLFQVMFNFRNLPPATHSRENSIVMEPFAFDSGLIGGLDLSFEAFERPGGIHCNFTYPTASFAPETIARLLANFEVLLRGLVAYPLEPVSKLPILTEAEKQLCLVSWNNTERDIARACVHEMFEAQANRTPGAVALTFKGRQATYRQLNDQSNQLARYLRAIGVTIDSLVAIYLEPSIDMVVAMIAVLKAGGAFVPLDVEYPGERIAFIIEDAKIKNVLTSDALLRERPIVHLRERQAKEVSVVCLERVRHLTAQESSADLGVEVEPSNLAYVIYTSGSTGSPKGVMACHAGLTNYLLWRKAYFPLSPGDRLLQKSSPSFDDSVWEIFEPLTVGAQVVIAEADRRNDISYLCRLISEHGITAACFVPSLLQLFVQQPDVGKLSSLRRITTGGETLSSDLQERFFTRCAANLYNGYGCTETTIGSTFWACERSINRGTVPIGKPIANSRVYILDDHLNPVPIGVVGEIFISGAGLARGYLNRPELTAEKFLPDPFSVEDAARMYRTGDRGRYRMDGNIDFIGRIDDQVKIRGFRIEMGEIESVLRQHPAIKAAGVIVREDQPSERSLAAYVVPYQDDALLGNELRRYLRAKLPDYMVPGVFVSLAALPLTPSGKLDRQGLPAPSRNRAELEDLHVEPRTALERELAVIWTEILGIDSIGVQDNFFDLGGHSLLATLVVSRIRGEFSVDLSLRVLFEHPTIDELAALVETSRSPKLDSGALAEILAELDVLSEADAERELSAGYTKQK